MKNVTIFIYNCNIEDVPSPNCYAGIALSHTVENMLIGTAASPYGIFAADVAYSSITVSVNGPKFL